MVVVSRVVVVDGEDDGGVVGWRRSQRASRAVRRGCSYGSAARPNATRLNVAYPEPDQTSRPGQVECVCVCPSSRLPLARV